jgi:iron-sulfur cluster assembly accessory protein
MSRRLVSLSASALARLRQISSRNKDHLVFGVQGGGCAGFQYDWKCLSKMVDKAPPVGKEAICLGNTFKLIVCPKSTLYLLGTRIDWKEGVFGTGFTYQNPLAETTCGCDVSFAPMSSKTKTQRQLT